MRKRGINRTIRSPRLRAWGEQNWGTCTAASQLYCFPAVTCPLILRIHTSNLFKFHSLISFLIKAITGCGLETNDRFGGNRAKE